MLSRPDAILVRSEPAWPGLSLLFDEDRFADVLRAAWPEAGLTSLKARYVRYKPNTSCIVGYEVMTRGQSRAVYAKSAPGCAPASAATPVAAAGRHMWPFALSEYRIAVRPYPFDAQVRSLVRMASDDQRSELMQQLWANAPDGWQGDAVPLAYKPERRCVLAWTPGVHPVATLRLYSDASYAHAHFASTAFGSRDVLRIPLRIGRSNRRRALLMQWMHGDSLDDCLLQAKPGANARVELVGAALAELHGQRAHKLPVLARSDEAASLDAAARAVVATCPGGRDAVGLGQRLGREIEALRLETVPVHGDFYANQVLVTMRRAAIIDLDRAARGDPALDLGTFIAHLELDVLRGRLSVSTAGRYAEALCVGYASVGMRPDDRRVRLYTAAGLLRLAPRPFRDREPDWPDTTRSVLDRALALMDTVGGVTVAASDASAAAVAAARSAPAATTAFGASLRRDGGQIRVRQIRQIRHKPGRRWLFEYDVESAAGLDTWIGKLRAKGCDHTTPELQRQLWSRGFGDDSADEVSVPEVIGTVPDLRLWLQRKRPGRPVSDLLGAHDPTSLGVRVALALLKLHASDIVSTRSHDIHDELRILNTALNALAVSHPTWQARVHRMLLACRRFDGLGTRAPRLLHRDFYADQILINGPRAYLVDLDTLAMGDPAVDAGNFIAHLMDLGLRQPARRPACDTVARAFLDTFLAGVVSTPASTVDAYVTLSLARLVQISTLFEDRRAWTGRLFELCEQRLHLEPYRWSEVLPEEPIRTPSDVVRG